MAKNRKKRPKKTTQEWEALTSDEVMQTIFGKRVQQTLKRQADTDDATLKNDYRLPPESI